MHRPPLGNRQLIRAINRSAVLNAVKTHGPIARNEVARRTGLSAATVTGITAELLENNLIIESAEGDSRGGRRPILLTLHPRGGYVVGLKLTERKVIGALVDLEATPVAKRSAPWRGHAPAAALDVMAAVTDGLLRDSRVRQKQLLGVGLGLAGIVDAKLGVLRQSPYLGWRDVPVRALLQERVRVPAYIDNDVNTLTLAEKWFGNGQGLDHFLTVTVGRGVGLGIVVNGQFYRGAHGGAGEFGHTVMDPDGPRCDCGKRGCLETYVGDPGLLRQAAEAADRGEIAPGVTSVETLLARCAAGEAGAQAVYARAGQVLGQGLANLVNVLDPQRIILSGEGVRAGEWLFGPMRAALGQHVLPGLAREVDLCLDVWGDDAWARGAASLVLRELFESPVHREAPLPAAVVDG